MRTLIAVPCLDTVHTLFMASLLALRRGEPGDAEIALSSSSLVYEARNMLAEKAVNGRFDRVLWLDSDMSFEPDLMERFAADLDEGREFVSCLYFTRKNPVKPVVYSECDISKTGRITLTPYSDYPRDSIFRIRACGFGAVMHSVDLLRKIGDKYGRPFSPEIGFGEDLSFCRRAEGVGAELYCDSRIRPGHIGLSIINESTWLDVMGGA